MEELIIKERHDHLLQLESVREEMESYRHELEYKYRQSLEETVDKEKRVYEDTLRRSVDKERVVKRSLEQQLRQLRTILIQVNQKDNNSKTMKKTDTVGPLELETLAKEVVEMTKNVVNTNVELAANVEQLSDKIKQNDRLNNVMASKIREFSEMMINEKRPSNGTLRKGFK